MSGPTSGQPPEPRARRDYFESFAELERNEIAAIGRIFEASSKGDQDVNKIVRQLVTVELFRTTSVVSDIVKAIELNHDATGVKDYERRLDLVTTLGHLKGLLRDIVSLGHSVAEAIYNDPAEAEI